MDRPGLSQVQTTAPNGSDVRWLGSLGAVTSLRYSYALPGGASAMIRAAASRAEPAYAVNPGRIVKIFRGGIVRWQGKLTEPVPSAQGWQISAIGNGALGNNFQAHYTSWTADNPINLAIARGLPWINPGLSGISGLWLQQTQDDASQTVTDFLNLLVHQRGADLVRRPAQRAADHPHPHGADAAADRHRPAGTHGRRRHQRSCGCVTRSPPTPPGHRRRLGRAATYGTVEATNAASQAVHGVMETYEDLSSAGVISSGTAQQAGAVCPRRLPAGHLRGTVHHPARAAAHHGRHPHRHRRRTGHPASLQGRARRRRLWRRGQSPGPPTFPIGSLRVRRHRADGRHHSASVGGSDLSSLLAAMFPTDASGKIALPS